MPSETDVVVVGAGQAGGRAVEALRHHGFAERIFLVGEEPQAPYERPPLSKAVLTGERTVESALLFPPDFCTANRIEFLPGCRVAAIDVSARRLQLADGCALGYGKLLLCTGGRVRTLDAAPPGRPGVHYLRTSADAQALAAAFRRSERLVVVGGGFLGLEIAASARKLGLAVSVVEAQPHLLSRTVAPEIAALVARLHRTKGVQILLQRRVARLVGGDRLEAVELNDGTRLVADTVAVAAGIEPSVELAGQAGARTGDGIVVDQFCRTTLENVFAAGDVTNHPNPLIGRRLRLESWQNAQNQAIAAALAICGKPKPYAEVPWFWSDQYEFNIQMVGVPLASDETVVRGNIEEGKCLLFNLARGTVVGATAFNMGGETRFAREMIAQRLAVPSELLRDPSNRLRDLLAALRPSPAPPPIASAQT